MKKSNTFSFFAILALLQLAIVGCKDDDSQGNSLSQTVAGTYHGTFNNWVDNTMIADYKVDIETVNDSTVELKAANFSNVVVTLEGDVDVAILGNSDSLLHFGYTVKDKTIELLYHETKFSYSGTKD